MLDGFSDTLLREINKKFKKADTKDIVFDGDASYEVASTCSAMIDFATGENVGGILVKGRLSEVSGMESSGKSTLAYSSSSYAINELEWTGALFDMEGTFDVEYARALGLVENEKFRVFRPTTAEDAEQLLNMLLGIGKGNSKFKTKIDFIIWDSIAATVPTVLLDAESSTGQGTAKGEHARYWGNFIKKINAQAIRQDIAFLLVNQLRNKIDMANQYQEKTIGVDNGLAAGYSSDTSKITTGGTGIKFFYSIRILLQQTKRLKEEVTVRGKKQNTKGRLNYIKMSVLKNKIGIPFKECTTAIQFGKGFRDEIPMYDYLKEQTDVISTTSSGVYTFNHNGTEFSVKGVSNFQKELFREYRNEMIEAYKYEKQIEYDEIYNLDDEEALEAILDEIEEDEIIEEEAVPKKVVKKKIKKLKRKLKP